MKKKILSLMLAVVMMLSLSVTAFAANPTPTSADATASLKKSYTGTGAPDEVFYLEQVGNVTVTQNNNVTNSEKAALDLDIITVEGVTADSGCNLVAASSVSSGEISFAIGLPRYTKVGVYTYVLREVNSETAGITYYSSDIYMVVTVEDIEGVLTPTIVYHSTSDTSTEDNKIDTITNEYSAGSLSITKEVTGNLGDTTKVFSGIVYFYSEDKVESTITFTDYNGSVTSYVPSNWSYYPNQYADSMNGKTNGYCCYYQFDIVDGGTLKIENIPYGVTYEVQETQYAALNDGYDAPTYSSTDNDEDSTMTDYVVLTDGTKTTVDGVTTVTVGSAAGTIDDASDSITITNNKSGDVDTGISLDSLPYILMLIVVAAGVVVMISRRRLNDKF